MNHHNKISISILFDSNYIEPALVTAIDVASKNLDPIDQIHLIYLNRSNEDDSIALELIQKFIASHNTKKKISAIIAEDTLPNFKKCHFSNSIIYKPLIPSLIKDTPYILNIDAGIITGNKFEKMINEVSELINKNECEWIIGAHCDNRSTQMPKELNEHPKNSRYPYGGIIFFNSRKFEESKYIERYLNKYHETNENLLYAEQELMCLTLQEDELLSLPYSNDRFIPFLSVEALVNSGIPWDVKQIEDSVFFKVIGTLKPWKYWVLDKNKRFWLKKASELDKIIQLSGNSLIEKNRHFITHEPIQKAFLEQYTNLIETDAI